jgi:hypothetical protein
MENILMGILKLNKDKQINKQIYKKQVLNTFCQLLEKYIQDSYSTLFILVSKDEIFNKINNIFEKNTHYDLYNINSVNKASSDILINNYNKQVIINEITKYKSKCSNDRSKYIVDFALQFGTINEDGLNISSELDDYTIALLIKYFKSSGNNNVKYLPS